uniref:amidohydrolase family protein n=1 Tax=Herbiconiux sp. TaxID=1871186 RepID=UPI0025C63441
IQVTAEATPHHLLLTEELIRSYDARYKVNPPLRRDEDVRALRQGVADGTIDCIATDHAPHPRESKECEWDAAAFGMVGLESALPVVQTALVDTGLLDWAGVARVLSTAPARIGRLDDHSHSFEDGAPANLTLVDPSASSSFALDRLHGRSTNTPYEGVTLSGSVRWTFHHGYPTLRDGVLAPVDETAGRTAGDPAREVR